MAKGRTLGATSFETTRHDSDPFRRANPANQRVASQVSRRGGGASVRGTKDQQPTNRFIGICVQPSKLYVYNIL